MQKPRALRPGDTLMTVSHSWGGAATHPQRYEAGKRQLEETFGVRVREAPHALRDAAWLYANPRARADDLMQAFRDPDVAGIVSIVGGDDAIRLIPFVDLNVIAANPKPFVGFSDATVIHMMCHRAGVVSFYGPSILKGFGENTGIPAYLADAVRRTMFSVEPSGRFTHNPGGWTDDFLDWADPANQLRKRSYEPPMPWRVLQGHGTVRGRLLGGCLEVLEWLRGTSLWPDQSCFDSAILFIETSEEGPSPRWVARQLRAYAALGILPRLAAILFGRPGGRIPPGNFALYDEWIVRVVRDEQGLLDLPIITRMDFGHTDPTFVLPYGVLAEVDCDTGAFSILEGGVT